MSESVQPVTFDQMKAAIGSLVWLWSRIEGGLAKAIRDLHAGDVPRTAYGISRSLDVWSSAVLSGVRDRGRQEQLCLRMTELLKDALRVRNLVCHGLINISAPLSHEGCEAHLEVHLNDSRRILTWSELNEMFAWMSRINWLIADLTAAAVESDPVKADRMVGPWQNYLPEMPVAGGSPDRLTASGASNAPPALPETGRPCRAPRLSGGRGRRGGGGGGR
jgi:hypothetical protein